MWEIYAYQNSDSLFGIFNAAAAIHASSDYMSAVAAVAFSLMATQTPPPMATSNSPTLTVLP